MELRERREQGGGGTPEGGGADSLEGVVSTPQGQCRPRTPVYFYIALSCHVTESPKPILRDSTSVTDTNHKQILPSDLTERESGVAFIVGEAETTPPCKCSDIKGPSKTPSEGKRPLGSRLTLSCDVFLSFCNCKCSVHTSSQFPSMAEHILLLFSCYFLDSLFFFRFFFLVDHF